MRILFEMAHDRKFVINKLMQDNTERIDHLLLVYFYTDNESVNRWLNEIYTWCRHSYRVGFRRKLLSSRQVYKAIWLALKDGITEKSVAITLKNFHTCKELPVIEEFNYNDVYNYLESFFKWLSIQLSNDDVVDAQLIKDKILQLVDEYK